MSAALPQPGPVEWPESVVEAARAAVAAAMVRATIASDHIGGYRYASGNMVRDHRLPGDRDELWRGPLEDTTSYAAALRHHKHLAAASVLVDAAFTSPAVVAHIAAAREEGRREALEEAAQCAEAAVIGAHDGPRTVIAAAIRALLPGGGA